MPELTTATGQRIYYQHIEGERDIPTLVFLHEGLGCVAMWDDFPRRLCGQTGCPGLVYDRIGYGRSSPLQQKRTVHYLHEYALMELPLVLERLLPASPVILVGHSDGGSIALIYAAERPSRLLGTITEAAHVYVDEETLAGIALAEKAWRQGKMGGLMKYHGDKTEELFWAWAETWQTSWFRSWNIEYLLPSISIPLLVIQGENDQYGTLAQVDAIVSASSGKNRFQIVEDCGHIPHIDDPDTVLESMSASIEEWLKNPNG